MKNSFKLFDFHGTPVYLKYWFLILLLFLSVKVVFVAFISVLIHEMAHAWVAKKLGYPVHRIYLDIFHGAAEIDLGYQNNYKDTIRIVSAGPLSNAALVLLSSCLLFSGIIPEAFVQFTKLFIIINLFLSIFNILPIYPLDGGRITKALFLKHFGKKGQLYSGIVSMVFSILVLLYALLAFDLILIFFSIIFIFISYYELDGRNELNQN